MIRRTSGVFSTFAVILTFLISADVEAQNSRPGFVATSEVVTGGILGSNPTIAAGLNELLAERLLTAPFLLEVADLDDPTYTNDGNITLNAFGGFDVDGDSSNNGSGSNAFAIDPSSFDEITGTPISSFPDGTIVDGHMVAGPGTIVVGGIPLNGLTVEADFTPGTLTGVYEFQSTPTSAFLTEDFLATQPAPAPFAGTLVDLLNTFNIFPDTDADSDGVNESYSAVFEFGGISCDLYYSYYPRAEGFVATSQVVTGGVLGSNPTIAAGLNDLLASNLDSFPFLLEVADLDDPTYQDDGDITLNAFGGFDLDGDFTDNGDGFNDFVIDPLDYDQVTGEPISSFPGGSLTAGHLVAGPGTIYVSGIPLNGLTVEADFFPSTLTGVYEFQSTPTSAFLTQSFLITQPAPAPFAGTLVDLLNTFNIFPDIDADNDGVNESYSAVFEFGGISCGLYHTGAPPSSGPIEDCANGVDDDGDTLADCDDPDCFSDPACNVGGTQFRRGDVNGDANVNIGDAVSLLGFLFSGGAAPGCDDAADVNDDGSMNIGDAVYELGFLFSGGAAPPAPGGTCGIDPTDTDPLDCATPTGGC
ncbi:MAG: dockerin type I repeat-containing protein [Planctomycetota bacterium]|nr:dockerin type I repeat-containing protein [Planctomycetota bacterium]